MPFPISGADEVVERVAAALSPRVKLAVLDHITSPSGIIYPIQELVNLCRERGIPVLVDGAHAPGMVELNLEQLGADWYTGNCHKWLFAPKGCAFLRTAPERTAETHALVVSHGYRQGYAAEFDFTGTKDYSPYLTVGDAIKFYLETGGNGIAAHNRALVIEMRRMLAETWGVPPPAPENMLGSLAALPVPADLPATVAAGAALHDILFDEYRIEVPVMPLEGKLWVRVSAQIFNEPDDYRKLAEVMPDAVKAAQERL
jgi:isopenicillin-N epimerase